MQGPSYTKGADRLPAAEGVYDSTTLGAMRKSPMVLYGIFTEIARNFYSSGILGERFPIWTPNANTTGIWIDQEQVWEDVAPQFRPAIYVTLSELKYGSDTGKATGLSGMRMEEGEYHFQQRCEGTVAWVHVGSTRSESLLLCETTLEMLSAFQQPIRDEFCFDKFHVIGFNPTKVEKEAREAFSSSVVATFSLQEAWTLKLESAKLKKIVFDIASQSATLLSDGVS